MLSCPAKCSFPATVRDSKTSVLCFLRGEREGEVSTKLALPCSRLDLLLQRCMERKTYKLPYVQQPQRLISPSQAVFYLFFSLLLPLEESYFFL